MQWTFYHESVIKQGVTNRKFGSMLKYFTGMEHQHFLHCFCLKTFCLPQLRLCFSKLGLILTSSKLGWCSMKLNAPEILIWEKFTLFLPSSSKKVRSQGSDLLLVLWDPMSLPHWHFEEVGFCSSFLLLFLTGFLWGRGSMLSKLSQESHKTYYVRQHQKKWLELKCKT